MDRYFKRKGNADSSSPSKNKKENHDKGQHSSEESCLDIDLASLPVDPGVRKPITSYHPNRRDDVRRAYLKMGPCQPHLDYLPQRPSGRSLQGFVYAWFREYSTWLEYSIEKDAAFCLCCYLFKPDNKQIQFVVGGFTNWKEKEKFDEHVGGPNSAHNLAWRNCQSLMNQGQQIQTVFQKQTDPARVDYRVLLNASIDCFRYLLRQGLAFRDHDESSDSSDCGIFLALLDFLQDHNEEVRRVCFHNALENLKLTSPDIQKDIVHACAIETTDAIIRDLGDSLFSILFDEARDVLLDGQMAIILRYVDMKGHVVERLLDIVRVADYSALSLKASLEEIFLRDGLSISRLRGQGYDGASNMWDEFNGLKALILKENPHAFYVHCFAHQLQLAIVATTEHNVHISTPFTMVTNVVNIVGDTCKHHDILQDNQAKKVLEALENSELSSGRSQNLETALNQPGDTRWGSYYFTLMSLLSDDVFYSVIDVLDIIVQDGSGLDQRGEAYRLLGSLQSFDFAFNMHMMKNILGITNELSQALQKKDQDIVNAMTLVQIAKQRLKAMRSKEGFDALLNEVSAFCSKQYIDVPHMDDMFVVRRRSRQNVEEMKNVHHYRVELFYSVIDEQLSELNDRFTDVNTELLLCVACLNPSDSFSAFDKHKLICLAKFYQVEFSAMELEVLDNQLETYIIDMRSNIQFSELKGINDLAEKMVEARKDVLYPLVYKLVTLALILPIANATVERVFSGMKIVKTRLRDEIGDQWTTDCLITYIEQDIFSSIKNEVIMRCFQNMKTCGRQL